MIKIIENFKFVMLGYFCVISLNNQTSNITKSGLNFKRHPNHRIIKKYPALPYDISFQITFLGQNLSKASAPKFTFCILRMSRYYITKFCLMDVKVLTYINKILYLHSFPKNPLSENENLNM